MLMACRQVRYAVGGMKLLVHRFKAQQRLSCSFLCFFVNDGGGAMGDLFHPALAFCLLLSVPVWQVGGLKMPDATPLAESTRLRPLGPSDVCDSRRGCAEARCCSQLNRESFPPVRRRLQQSFKKLSFSAQVCWALRMVLLRLSTSAYLQ